MEITLEQHRYYRGYLLRELSSQLSKTTGVNVSEYFLHRIFKNNIFHVKTMAGMSSDVAAWGFYLIRVISLVEWGIFLREPGEPDGVEYLEFKEFINYKMNQYENR